MEVNNLLSSKDTIIDKSITCPHCGKSDSLRMNKFTYNTVENKLEIGCTRCYNGWFDVDDVKVEMEEYVETHKRLRFSK